MMNHRDGDHRALRPIRHSNERRSSDRDTIFFELLATKRAWLSLFWGRGSNEAFLPMRLPCLRSTRRRKKQGQAPGKRFLQSKRMIAVVRKI
jgi:hypothetical protein